MLGSKKSENALFTQRSSTLRDRDLTDRLNRFKKRPILEEENKSSDILSKDVAPSRAEKDEDVIVIGISGSISSGKTTL